MDKIKNIAKKILVVLGCLFVIVIIIGIIAPSEETTLVVETPKVEKTTRIKVPTKRLSDELRASYIDGCTGNDVANTAYCLCTIDYLEEHYSEEHIITVSLTMEDGDIPVELEEAAFSCYKELLE